MRARCPECALERSANLPDLEKGPDGHRAVTWAARIGRRLLPESAAIQVAGPNRAHRQGSRQPTSLSPFLNDEFRRLRKERSDSDFTAHPSEHQQGQTRTHQLIGSGILHLSLPDGLRCGYRQKYCSNDGGTHPKLFTRLSTRGVGGGTRIRYTTVPERAFHSPALHFCRMVRKLKVIAMSCCRFSGHHRPVSLTSLTAFVGSPLSSHACSEQTSASR